MPHCLFPIPDTWQGTSPYLSLLGLAASWQPQKLNSKKVRQWKRRHPQPKVTAELLHRFQRFHWGFKSLKASVSNSMWFLPRSLRIRKPQATDSREGADDGAIWGRTWLGENAITIPYFSFPTQLVCVKGTGLTSLENSCLLINYN